MSPDGSAGSMRDVGKDPSKTADVFQVPHDQLGQLADEGYINPLVVLKKLIILKVKIHQLVIKQLIGKEKNGGIHLGYKLQRFTIIRKS